MTLYRSMSEGSSAINMFSNSKIPQSGLCPALCVLRQCTVVFLFVRVWAMPRILHLSYGVSFPVWTPDNIYGLISVVPWLSREEVIKKIAGNNF